MNVIGYITKKIEGFVSRNCIGMCWVEKYYAQLVKNEISLGDITAEDRVMCIGGGPVPCTAIGIARETGAKVAVVDNDPMAVKLASELIKRLNLKDRIEVIEANGQNLMPNEFTVIHIAKQVCPREEVLKYMWNNVSEGTRILVRNPQKGLKFLYENRCSRKIKNEKADEFLTEEEMINGTLLFVR
ncbi:nicotianamine synthase-like protein [Natranaerovirga pectinivora]|uniref:Nicotianamine synthase-like protein n=1 Tax=Natranaerovirga pectinivora TaxID=682400 RepID=A0A4V2UZY0_9FIRM|nr:nicotianamine synthase family protein [Natranaerovirga pectinivora]TCT12991.1 nicotianamine synthase-like protein [Natranaerovirga pectinivora]